MSGGHGGQGRLAGRIALVTGGSRGVGRGIAVRLGAEGASVAVGYRRDEDSANAVVEAVRDTGSTAAAFRAPLDDPDAVASLPDRIRKVLGPVDLLVSNAGIASRGHTIAETDPAEYLRLLSVHTLGPLELVRRLLPDLRLAGRADVIVVSSVVSSACPPGSAPYTMAKVALEAAARTLAFEERGNGVRVNVVAPGLVETEMGERLVAALGGGDLDRIAERYPFGRVAHPDDVAATVAFLASAEAGYLTGQRIEIDGGGPVPVGLPH